MDKFIHIRSTKFPILPGEKEELVNDGMYGKALAKYLQEKLKKRGKYGKALAKYLQEKLKKRGYNAPFFCCEDWGWWLELKDAPFTFGVCIYYWPESDRPHDLFCADGVTSRRRWSWSKFRMIDTTPWVTKLHEDLVSIFGSDPEIELVSTSLNSPFSEDRDNEI
jgi:hypothetical protein